MVSFLSQVVVVVARRRGVDLGSSLKQLARIPGRAPLCRGGGSPNDAAPSSGSLSFARRLRATATGSLASRRVSQRWLLRWLADTAPTYILLNKLKKANKQGGWRIRKSLPMKYETMKRAYSNVKYEFAVTFEQYEIDHELLISDWEAVLDTCATRRTRARTRTPKPEP